MSIRLAFTGASGTGKTTLATALSRGRLNLDMCRVGSRSVSRAMGFDSPYDVDAAGKRSEFQRQLLDQKQAWERSRNDFVTDRTHLDNLAYTLGHAPHLGADPEFVKQVQDGMERYTHIVFCPMASVFMPGDDSARVNDYAYHKAYEAVLIELLFKHVPEVPILWLTSKVEEKRVKQVLKYVNS